MKREESYSKYKELFRSETREYLAQLNQYIINLEKKPEEIETIDAIFRNYHTIKGMAGTMGYKIIESLSHSLEDLLSLIKNGKLSVDSNIIDLMLEGTDKIELMIENPKMENEEIQALIMRISDIKEGKGLAQDAEKKLEIKARIAKKSDIRVEIKKLDNLQNLLSELVIAKESLKRVVRSNERESIFNETDRISNIVSALQDEVVRIRMVPIWQIFERFPRVVRDTAKEMGKKVDFEIRGKDIELDRSMLENLAEPLIHLLRNSIYHGIEMPEERKRLGKLEEGHLILEASRQKGIVLIKV
ncbi:Hpt domain-containing protein, partial [candidate division WOR-3 bacterium]|nr:Hpt domain-containing protein [candidate division WOR-3 bacterium]